MKTIKFNCVNCETVRKIIIKQANEFYLLGKCDVCKARVNINRSKAKNI